MSRPTLRIVAASIVLATLACGDSTGPAKTFTARFLNGATHAAGAPGAPPIARSAAVEHGAQSNANWLLTPDRVTITVTGLRLTSDTTNSDALNAVNCTVTYEVTKPGLSLLDNCPFPVAPGTYNEVEMAISATMQVFVNDAVNGFYSTATGIATSAPVGGAANFSYTYGGGDANDGTVKIIGPLTAPIVVSDSSTLNTVNAVVNGAQWLHLALNNGTATVGWPLDGTAAAGRPDIIVTAGAPAAVEFYARNPFATAGSFCAGDIGCSPPGAFPTVAVYYSAPGVAAFVGIAPGSGVCTPQGPSFMNNAKAYVGLDASGNLGWANGVGTFNGQGTDTTYSHYSAIFRMTRRTTLGDTTTLFCQNITADPAPTGGSFASGAPNIASAANTVGTYVLVAH